ncbi:hypothetical protein M5K25_014765 [Dendrobium thyrsiflorum]|uniref:PORR domain-containing protein n=1 Tax=Dendrobium thyrsiflorum TaxID=117978 RepID=A0ABD0UPC8_DENTH
MQSRTFIDARIHWVRDRGLDHAVEKEKHLLPFHYLKDLLIHSFPSSSATASSVPLDAISERRQDLRLPFRAIRFIRLFPTAFIEETPDHSASSSSSSSSPLRPSIRPTDDLMLIHSEELRAFESSRDNAADRLLRLLMLAPYRRLPLPLIDRLRWDLGLPCDFVRSLLPDFPDYFQISPSSGRDNLDIELVCYRKDLAVSAMEDYAMRTGGYKKGASLAFPLHFSRGFELEKKVRKWLDEWQKLPYVSPYESGSNLPPKSDIAEKWIVGVLHEVLNMLIGKKTEMENLVLLGQHLGLPAGFRKVIAHHPGIFYISNKLRTQTVVLREAYRRDLLIVKHPMMGLVEDDEDHEAEAEGMEEGREDEDDADYKFSESSDFESGDEESDDDDDDDRVRDVNLSPPTQEIQARIPSPIRASPIERKLLTSKIRRNEMHKVGKRNSAAAEIRAGKEEFAEFFLRSGKSSSNFGFFGMAAKKVDALEERLEGEMNQIKETVEERMSFMEGQVADLRDMMKKMLEFQTQSAAYDANGPEAKNTNSEIHREEEEVEIVEGRRGRPHLEPFQREERGERRRIWGKAGLWRYGAKRLVSHAISIFLGLDIPAGGGSIPLLAAPHAQVKEAKLKHGATIEVAGKILVKIQQSVHVVVSLVNLCKAHDKVAMHAMAVKYGGKYVDLFLKAFDFLQAQFQSHNELIIQMFKEFQKATRVIQALCSEAKGSKRTMVTSKVPATKRSMEKFLFHVKALLHNNSSSGCTFWMGNLKHKNLYGQVVSSQLYSNGEDPNRDELGESVGEAGEDEDEDWFGGGEASEDEDWSGAGEDGEDEDWSEGEKVAEKKETRDDSFFLYI